MRTMLCYVLFGSLLLLLSCGPEDMRKKLPTAAPTDTTTNYTNNVTEHFSFEGAAIETIKADVATHITATNQRCYSGNVTVVLFDGATTLTCDSLLLSMDDENPNAIVLGAFKMQQDSMTIQGTGLEVENWLLWDSYTMKGMTGVVVHDADSSSK